MKAYTHAITIFGMAGATEGGQDRSPIIVGATSQKAAEAWLNEKGFEPVPGQLNLRWILKRASTLTDALGITYCGIPVNGLEASLFPIKNLDSISLESA